MLLPTPTNASHLNRIRPRWKHQIAAWHRTHVSNGPTEAVNNLIQRVKRVAFGFTRFRNCRIRVLRYAGRPKWDLSQSSNPTDVGPPKERSSPADPTRSSSIEALPGVSVSGPPRTRRRGREADRRSA
jgi:hypothetical protein